MKKNEAKMFGIVPTTIGDLLHSFPINQSDTIISEMQPPNA